jgi:hypothetical protein
VKTTRQTTGAGIYVLSPLTPGSYTITVSASGFQPETWWLFAPRAMGLDLSVRRNFKITERVTFALQTDAFNVTNSVFFGAPAANVDSANFGTLTSQANQPRKLQISGRISF